MGIQQGIGWGSSRGSDGDPAGDRVGSKWHTTIGTSINSPANAVHCVCTASSARSIPPIPHGRSQIPHGQPRKFHIVNPASPARSIPQIPHGQSRKITEPPLGCRGGRSGCGV